MEIRDDASTIQNGNAYSLDYPQNVAIPYSQDQ